MFLDFLTEEFKNNSQKTAIVWNDQPYSYQTLLELFEKRKAEISQISDIKGKVVALKSDFSLESTSMFLALAENECIIVPVNSKTKEDVKRIYDISMVELLIEIDNNNITFTETGKSSDHEYYNVLRERKHPGIVLFSSGTSGEPKAAVNDFTALLEKFKTRRYALTTLNFLLFDHIGGVNTMLHTLSNGGKLVFTKERTPEFICRQIEKHKVELLPVSPTFLNLLLISEAYKDFDLSSLKKITYGTEPMPEGTLKRLNIIFPDIKFQQTYGLMEVGILRTASQSNNSLWVKLGGEGYELRIVDDILHIKTPSGILGYLNYPTPYSDDGWFITGDHVETQGEFFRILGRRSELINIGGEKVYPVEIETVLKEIDNVGEAIIYSEPNSITGNIICAEVTMIKDEDKGEFRSKIKKYCHENLQSFKVPAKIIIADKIEYTDRFKKKQIKRILPNSNSTDAK